MIEKENSSWELVSDWYNQIVGDKGHKQHQIIIPKILKLMGIQKNKEKTPSSLLDIGCGQGVILHYLPQHISYIGIDLSNKLLSFAKRQKRKNTSFLQEDATHPELQLNQTFTDAIALLSLQNMNNGQMVFQNVSKHLVSGGKFGCVINHPAFRIPRNSHWCFDHNQKRIFRRLDYYLSSLKVPIQSRPSRGEKSPCTWSYHAPLSAYFEWAAKAKFNLISFQEWTNESKIEREKEMTRVTKEFPLFAALVFQKA